jgi:phosphate:Na+ symporter
MNYFKNQLLFTLVLFVGAFQHTFATALDSVQGNYQIEITPQPIDIPGLQIGTFDNYTSVGDDGNTIVKELGAISLNWTPFAGKPMRIKYQLENTSEWIFTTTFDPEIGKFSIDSIPENKFGIVAFEIGDEQSKYTEFNTICNTIFENFAISPGPEQAKLSWSLDYNVVSKLKDSDYRIFVKYNTSIGKDRNKKGLSGSEWKYSQPLSLEETSTSFEGLSGNEKYVFQIGLGKEGYAKEIKDNDKKIIWSSASKTKTERGWGIQKFLILIGSLGFFIYGMKIMSEGIQKAAGGNLRKMLGAMTSNRIKGVFTGFGITSIVQSSSVTTVMTVSFVNAGLMTLKESVGVMMGANVGTTITGWLVLTLGFKINIADYALMLIAIATPLLFVNKSKVKAWAEAIFGFCILFIGLGFLKEAVPALTKDSALVQFFIDYKDLWFGPFMFVILGTLVTIIIQSSSAAMALTLTLVSNGIIPFEVACAMILGENIGTTITAALAAMIGNVHAKRAARIHMMFNVFGVIWMLLVFPFFLKGLAMMVDGDPYSDIGVATTMIAVFHTVFNVLNLAILIWFVPQLVKIAIKTVPSKGDLDEEFKLDYIGGPLGSTAELNILEAKKEVAKFGEITSRMNKFVGTLINSSDKKKKNKMLTKLEKYEDITDRVEVEIGTYLGKTARLEMSKEASISMRSMLSITTDLERIGDIFYQMSKAIEKKDNENNYFVPEQREGINQMLELTAQAFEIMNHNLSLEYGTISIDKAVEKEREINQLRNQLRFKHLESFNDDPEYHMNSSIIYNNLFSSLEKVGDHIINVSEAVAGEI